MQYIALLRGINVGGNNKVSMADLKVALTKAKLQNIRTYINSGNVIFESGEKDERKLEIICEKAIEKRFGFPVDCVVISADDYKAIVASAPKYWGNGDKDVRSDALFLVTPLTTQQVLDAVGPVNNEFEWVDAGDRVVFWTLNRSHYTRSRLPKIIGTNVYRQLTMRSSTTTRKLLLLLETE